MTRRASIAIIANTPIRLNTDLITATSLLTDRHTISFGRIQFIAAFADAGTIQIALTIGTTQWAGGHTVIAMIQNEFIETLTDTALNAKSIFLTLIATIRYTLVPVEIVTLVALTTDIDFIIIRIAGTAIAAYRYIFFVLEEDSSRGREREKLIKFTALLHIHLRHFDFTFRRIEILSRQ